MGHGICGGSKDFVWIGSVFSHMFRWVQESVIRLGRTLHKYSYSWDCLRQTCGEIVVAGSFDTHAIVIFAALHGNWVRILKKPVAPTDSIGLRFANAARTFFSPFACGSTIVCFFEGTPSFILRSWNRGCCEFHKLKWPSFWRLSHWWRTIVDTHSPNIVGSHHSTILGASLVCLGAPKMS